MTTPNEKQAEQNEAVHPSTQDNEERPVDVEQEEGVEDPVERRGHSTAETHAAEEAEVVEESTDSNQENDDQPSAEKLTQLQEQMRTLEQKCEEYYEKLLRTQADFDNYRRRTQKERQDQVAYASQALIEKLLPTLDNMERALSVDETQDTSSVIKGVEMVFNQIEDVLKEDGLSVIATVGEPFDPHVHQAVAQAEDAAYDSGVVVEELQKGYQLKDKVIRPAMVKVNA